MPTNKRMIHDYEVLSSIKVGEKEIFIACDAKNQDGAKYLCGFVDFDGLLERYSDCVGSDDYLETAKEYGTRISQEAERFREVIEKLEASSAPLTLNDCILDNYDNSIVGKVVVMRADVFRPEYQRADNQLYLVEGGFGAEANARGRAVYAKNIFTGKSSRFDRQDVLGEIKPERMPEWAKARLKELHRKEAKEKSPER